MKTVRWGFVALAMVATGVALAGDLPGQPIDTKNLIVQPTRAVANLTSATIQMAGQTAASQVESNGYFKTLKNLLRRPTPTTVQAGPSRIPAPTLYPSTNYKSYNTPVMPIAMPRR